MVKIIGGTYREIDIDTITHNIFGSGLRAVNFFLENSGQEISYYTVGNKLIESHLENFKNVYPKFNYKVSNSNQVLTFKYDFATDEPRIYPNPRILKDKPTIEVSNGNIICFGMLDAEFCINAQKVVYDPQTGINPAKFSDYGKTEELIYIVNHGEAKSISNQIELEGILSFFFDEEKVKAVIIKDGPHGARLYESKSNFYHIPAYKTKNVYKIGSGDVFTSSFAFFWFNQKYTIRESALRASKSTAIFCNSMTYKLPDLNFSNFDFEIQPLKDLNIKQVYLAAPIFSLSDVILIDKIRESLLGFGIKVFSPYHDIGYGDDKEITEKDLEGIDNSDIIFSVLDGLDSGTLIELGYAMSKGKKIIGYHRTINSDSLLMLKTADIEFFDNLTTALYQVIWNV